MLWAEVQLLVKKSKRHPALAIDLHQWRRWPNL